MHAVRCGVDATAAAEHDRVVARYHGLLVRFNSLAYRCRELHDASLASNALLSAQLAAHLASSATLAPPLYGERECVVCLQPAERWVLLRPCGHVCACAECAYRLAQCPVCRGAVTERLVAYL